MWTLRRAHQASLGILCFEAQLFHNTKECVLQLHQYHILLVCLLSVKMPSLTFGLKLRKSYHSATRNWRSLLVANPLASIYGAFTAFVGWFYTEQILQQSWPHYFRSLKRVCYLKNLDIVHSLRYVRWIHMQRTTCNRNKRSSFCLHNIYLASQRWHALGLHSAGFVLASKPAKFQF